MVISHQSTALTLMFADPHAEQKKAAHIILALYTFDKSDEHFERKVYRTTS